MIKYAILSKNKVSFEDFIDEDTGEVISIKRSEILEYFIDTFNVCKNKLLAIEQIKTTINSFNKENTFENQERKLQWVITKSVYDKLKGKSEKEIATYYNRVIGQLNNSINNLKIHELIHK